jgi:PAS domain S-box-containing protein
MDSEAKYRSLVENTVNGIISVNLEGRFTFVNRAICAMTGYAEKELIGKPFVGLIHLDDRLRILGAFQNFMMNPDLKPRFEFRVIHKKRHVVHLYSVHTLIRFEDKIIGSHAIITDIIERKEMEGLYDVRRSDFEYY